jgi:hypothetical protein
MLVRLLLSGAQVRNLKNLCVYQDWINKEIFHRIWEPDVSLSKKEVTNKGQKTRMNLVVIEKNQLLGWTFVFKKYTGRYRNKYRSYMLGCEYTYTAVFCKALKAMTFQKQW